MCKMWKIVLWVYVAVWGGVQQSRATFFYNMANLTTIMERDIDDKNDIITVNYTSPGVSNFQAKALNEFDMRAMGPIYNATHMVIDVIADKQAYPPGIISVSDGHVYIAPLKREWTKLLHHYSGVTAVTVIVGLFVVILPLVGLLWSCCCWCRKRRRRRPFDRKYDNCRKGILTLVLIGLLTLFLFGVVCAFSTESQLESSLSEASYDIRHNAAAARDYINMTQAQTNWILTNNYDQLEDKLVEMLNSIGYRASLRLSSVTRVSDVGRLTVLVSQLDTLRDDLLIAHNLTQRLRTRADQLNIGLRKVKSQLLQTLARCDQQKCITLRNKYKINELDTEIPYSRMPDMSEMVSKVSSLLDSNIKAEVAAGERVLTDIQNNIQRSVTNNIPAVRKTIRDTGRHLAGVARQVSQLAEEASAKLSEADTVADKLQDVYVTYGPYRQYVGLGTACAILLIMSVMVWGLMCGVCGKRPDVYGVTDCCNKASGTKSLYCGVVLIFVMSWMIALVFIVYFIVGVATQRFICDPLVEPRNNRLFSDVEKFVDLEMSVYNERTSERFNMTNVIVQCHQNKTLYEVLQLHRIIKLDTMKRSVESEMESQLSSLRPTLTSNGQRIIVLSTSARNKLKRLATAGIDEFDFDGIFTALETNLTSHALDSLSQQLLNAASSLDQSTYNVEARELRRAATDLTTLSDNVLTPIVRDVAVLNETALRLQHNRRWIGDDSAVIPTMSSSLSTPSSVFSVEEIVTSLVETAEQAEYLINEQGPALLDKLIREYGNTLKEQVSLYLQRVRKATLDDVGRCGPLSSLFNSTRGIACERVLLPVNGYWLSLAWCIVLFIPMILVAVRLAKLYLHADPYPGPLVEAEYLYDAYADRDNVPLANGSKRSTLDIEGKIAEWRDRSAPSAPPHEGSGGGGGGCGTRVLLAGAGGDVVCELVGPPPALIDDLKTRLDAKDEDNESGIHESDAYKAEKRSGREGRGGRSREAEGRGGVAGAAGLGAGAAAGVGARTDTALAPPLDAYHARRYNDMAPKHWEEGPPRYHGPTEYERPPPYYYPGPNDRQ